MAGSLRITQRRSTNGANPKQRDTLRTLGLGKIGRRHTQPVNLRDLDARFDDGAEVTPDALRSAGLATRKAVPVKVLGQGELSKKLTVHAHGFSKSAREKIEGAGGTCQVLEK